MSDEVLDVLDLEAACERKDAEIERLTAEVEKLRDPKLSHMRFENGRLDMALVSPVIEGLATALGGWFVDNGAKNYVEMRLHDRHETGQVYILTVQKSGAKTPHELRTEAENKAAAEIASLKAEVERKDAGAIARDRTISDLTMIVTRLLKHAPVEKVYEVSEYLHRSGLASPLRDAAINQEPRT
jgi:hypothetical protein